jgi:hypothetical protein
MKIMHGRSLNALCFAASLAVFGLAGCGKNPGPPPPLSVEQIPAELQKAFNNTGSETKEVVGRVISTLQSKDYPTAYEEIQTLCALPDETQEQRLLAARALLTLTGLLQTAQSQGDERAAAALKLRQTSR